MTDQRSTNDGSTSLPEITPGDGTGKKSGKWMPPTPARPAQTAVPEVLPGDGAEMPKIGSVPGGGGGGVKMKMKRAAQIGVAPVQMVQQLPSFAYRHRWALLAIGCIAAVAIFTASYFAKQAQEEKKRNEILAGSQKSMDKVNKKFAEASSLQELRLATNTAKHEKGINGGRSTLLTGLSGGDRTALSAVLVAEGDLLAAYGALAGASQANLASTSKTDALIREVKAAVAKLKAADSAAAAAGIDVTMNAALLTDSQANILKLLRKARGRKPAKPKKKAKSNSSGQVVPQTVTPQTQSQAPAPSSGNSQPKSTPKSDSSPAPSAGPPEDLSSE